MNTNTTRSKGFTLVELLVVITLIFIAAAIFVGFAALVGGGCTISDGSRSGTVTKFSHKGIFHKTWEGEMVLGGIRSSINGGFAANVWCFSVTDDEIAKKVDAAKDTMEPILLYYHQQLINFPIVKDTTYTVWKVEQPKLKTAEK